MGSAAWRVRGTAWCIFLALALLQTRRVLAGWPDLWPAGNDFHPLVAHTVLQLRGELLWTSAVGGGHPLYANPLTSLWYPLVTLPVALLGPGAGLAAVLVLHLALAGATFHRFARRFTAREDLRVLGGALFLLSGAFAARAYAGHLNLLVPLAWTPLALDLLLDVAEGAGRRAVAGAALVLALMGLVDLQMPILFGLVVLALMVSEGLAWPGGPWRRPAPKVPVLRGLAAVPLLAALVAGVKVLPVAVFTRFIGRDVEALTGSVSITEQLGWFAANYRGPLLSNEFHEYYAYVGLVPCALAVIGALASPARKRPLLAILFAVALWAQGFFSPLAFLHELPVLDLIRNPARALLLALPVVVLLAVLGLAELPSLLARVPVGTGIVLRRAFLAVAGLQALELAMPALVFALLPDRSAWFAVRTGFDVGPVDLAAALLGGGLVGALLTRGDLRRLRRLPEGLAAFAVVSLLAVNGSLFLAGEPPSGRDVAGTLAGALPAHDHPLVETRGLPHDLDLTLAGVPLVGGEFGVSGEWRGAATPTSYLMGGGARAFRDFLVTTEPASGANLTLRANLTTRAAGPVLVYRQEDALPTAFVPVGDVAVPVPVLFVDGGRWTIDAPALASGERIVVKQAWYPGWRADAPLTVEEDQRFVALVADGAAFEGGLVTIEFAPRDVWIGLALTLVGAAVSAWLIASAWRRPRG